MKQTRAYVMARLDRPLRITQIANHLELSCFYFARRFKQAVGQPPGQFIIQMKMQRAQELLLTTKFSVIAVGMEVGYDNPSHFSGAFKSVVGLSPVQLRRTQLGKA